MKTFKNILEEVATKDDDDTAGAKQSDADAYRSHMTDPGASSLLGNDHVRMSTLIKENYLTSFSTDFTLSGRNLLHRDIQGTSFQSWSSTDPISGPRRWH